jgi:hypothetical protein
MSKEMRQQMDTFKQRLTENLNVSDVSDSDDIQNMSLEEKLLRMKLKMYGENLTLGQMECVIDAMKEVSLQRKMGNWTDKLK